MKVCSLNAMNSILQNISQIEGQSEKMMFGKFKKSNFNFRTEEYVTELT
jgi:hypothetical protein